MSEDSLIGKLMPVFKEPEIEGYKEIQKEVLKKEEWFSGHENPNTTEDHADIQLRIDRIESEWGKRPQNFSSIDSANGYFMHVDNAISSVTSCMNEIIKKHVQRERYISTHFDQIGLYGFLNFAAGIVLALNVGEDIYDNYNHRVTVEMWWVVAAYFVGNFLSKIVLSIVDIPFKKRRGRKFDNNLPELPSWIIATNNKIKLLSDRIDLAKPEIYADIEHTKKLMRKIKEEMVDDHFEGLKSKRSLEERIAIIEAEMERARSTAKTLEEEHRLTEAVRKRYAEELIDLERKVKEENNQDLKEKLALVESLLSNGEIGNE